MVLSQFKLAAIDVILRPSMITFVRLFHCLRSKSAERAYIIQRSIFSFSAEPIVNEHPVTIYPGRASPPRRLPSRNLPGSIERHGSAAATAVCRPGNYPSDNSQSSQETSSPENNESENNSSLSPTHGVPLNINYNHGLVTNRIFATSSAVEFTRPTRPRNGKQPRHEDSDEERFSEDSLEESSLQPPPGPVTVPPPPSLSAPVTPSKRHSIAWEVNLDDPASFGDPLTTAKPATSGSGCSKVSAIKPQSSFYTLFIH